jgi:hypothetical protein
LNQADVRDGRWLSPRVNAPPEFARQFVVSAARVPQEPRTTRSDSVSRFPCEALVLLFGALHIALHIDDTQPADEAAITLSVTLLQPFPWEMFREASLGVQYESHRTVINEVDFHLGLKDACFHCNVTRS